MLVKTLGLGLFLSASLIAANTWAVEVLPTSYDMLNGQSGSYNYWDESYDGSGNTSVDGAALTGGTGDLTDGFVSTERWATAEAPTGPGPYVGWSSITPTITFNFAANTDIDTIDFYFADDDGAGGVAAPGSVNIGGTLYSITDPLGADPFRFRVDSLGLLNVSSLTVTINDGRAPWVFVSEIDFFDGSNSGSAPAPASIALLGLGLAGMSYRRRKQIKAA